MFPGENVLIRLDRGVFHAGRGKAPGRKATDANPPAGSCVLLRRKCDESSWLTNGANGGTLGRGRKPRSVVHGECPIISASSSPASTPLLIFRRIRRSSATRVVAPVRRPCPGRFLRRRVRGARWAHSSRIKLSGDLLTERIDGI